VTLRATAFFHVLAFVVGVNHIFSTLFALVRTRRILEAQHLELSIKLRHQLLRVKRRRAELRLLLAVVHENALHIMTFTFLFQIQSAP
jgi:hypothetical protein